MIKKIIRTQEEINEFIELIDSNEPVVISLDIETDFFSDEKWHTLQLGLQGIGLYDGINAGYIVHYEGNDYSGLDYLIHQHPILGHNIKFDLQVLLNHGFITDLDGITINDTKILSFLHDENKSSHGLKKLATEVLNKKDVVKLDDVGPKPIMEHNLFTVSDEGKQAFYDVDIKPWEDKMGSYCIDDCVNTFELFQYFIKDITTQNPRIIDIYNKIEMPFLKVLLDMESKGITIDLNYLKEIGENITNKILDLQIQIYKVAGIDFNIGSPKQLLEVFDKLNIVVPDKYKTPKGEISTATATLKYLKSQGIKLGDLLLEWREYSKLENGFIDSLIEKQINGRIHTDFNQIGTVTGRLSCKVPNLQQIPRRNDEFDVRKAFISDKDHSFIIADLGQVELRMLAHFSQEEVLLKAFTEGKDIHQETADKLNITRFEAKAVNFGILYGMTSYGLAETTGLTRVKADEIIKDYFRELPKVKIFIDNCIKTAKQNGFINTILGRKRRFPDYGKLVMPEGLNEAETKKFKLEYFKTQSGMERQMVNSMIQGSVGDYMKLSMRNVKKEIQKYGAVILIQIHDEIIVQCPNENIETVTALVKVYMENAIKLNGVTMSVEPKIASRWEK